MADPILKEKDGDITTITLNRPEAGNRQTDATWAEVTRMLDDAANDSRVILFKGAGEDFCLGRETMGQPPPSPAPEAYSVRDRSDTIFNLYGAFRNAKAPIIGIVQGRAVGLGCALAALCDITIAGDKARFQFPETAHRIMPTIAFSALVDRVPRKAATYMIYSTAEIDAHKALTFGLDQQRRAASRIGGQRQSAGRAFQEDAAARGVRGERICPHSVRHRRPGRHRFRAQPARDG